DYLVERCGRTRTGMPVAHAEDVGLGARGRRGKRSEDERDTEQCVTNEALRAQPHVSSVKRSHEGEYSATLTRRGERCLVFDALPAREFLRLCLAHPTAQVRREAAAVVRRRRRT